MDETEKSQQFHSSIKLPNRFPRRGNDTLGPGPGGYEVTGALGIASRGKSAPAFSFSIKHAPHKDEHVPGPGAYEHSDRRHDIGVAPAYTMGGRKVPKPEDSPVPGPGAYAHTAHVGEGPKKTMSSKLVTAKESFYINPGPGAYEHADIRPHSAPSYSMTGRAKDLQQFSTPGPGAYEEKDKRKDFGVAPAYTMRVKLESKHGSYIEVPGPGAYEGNHHAVKPASAAYTMSGRLNGGKDAEVPGPGAYEQNSSPLKPKSPSYTMRIKPTSPDGLVVPGPGAYEHHDVARAAPVYSMAQRLETKHGTYIEVPGPGAYTASHGTTKPASPQYSLSSRMKPTPLYETPGPGAYTANAQTVKHQSPSYTLGGKTALPKIEKFDIQFATPTTTLGGPSYTMRVKPKDKSTSFAPGPGAYENKSHTQTGPKYSMGPGLPVGAITQLLSSTV